MLIKKMILRKPDVRKIRKCVALFLAGFIVFLFALSLDVHAAGKVKANGLLTSIERDGTVIIDGVGYMLSPSLKVQDNEGRPISILNIDLPYNIQFEYEYTREGFTIIFIKENSG